MGSVGTQIESTNFPTNFSYTQENNADFEPYNKLEPLDWQHANDSYAEYLASSFYEGSNGELYVYEAGNNNRAFVHIQNKDYLDALGSTGGGAGTEAFIRVLEVQAGNNRGLSWSTDNKDSSDYYDHLGLSKYGKDNGWVKGSKDYKIPANEVAKVVRKLRHKYRRK